MNLPKQYKINIEILISIYNITLYSFLFRCKSLGSSFDVPILTLSVKALLTGGWREVQSGLPFAVGLTAYPSYLIDTIGTTVKV